eukprot:Rhum_TRINITY_DN3006_c0_g1::Rhum_TRINITY_DN3006_c0_g1_i1::g.9226::m.9226
MCVSRVVVSARMEPSGSLWQKTCVCVCNYIFYSYPSFSFSHFCKLAVVTVGVVGGGGLFESDSVQLCASSPATCRESSVRSLRKAKGGLLRHPRRPGRGVLVLWVSGKEVVLHGVEVRVDKLLSDGEKTHCVDLVSHVRNRQALVLLREHLLDDHVAVVVGPQHAFGAAVLDRVRRADHLVHPRVARVEAQEARRVLPELTDELLLAPLHLTGRRQVLRGRRRVVRGREQRRDGNLVRRRDLLHQVLDDHDVEAVRREEPAERVVHADVPAVLAENDGHGHEEGAAPCVFPQQQAIPHSVKEQADVEVHALRAFSAENGHAGVDELQVGDALSPQDHLVVLEVPYLLLARRRIEGASVVVAAHDDEVQVRRLCAQAAHARTEGEELQVLLVHLFSKRVLQLGANLHGLLESLLGHHELVAGVDDAVAVQRPVHGGAEVVG